MKTKLTAFLTASLLSLSLASCASSSGAKPYPLDVCIVSGNKLGSMGTPVTKVHNGQEVKFCCDPCVKKFDAKPETYLAKLH